MKLEEIKRIAEARTKGKFEIPTGISGVLVREGNGSYYGIECRHGDAEALAMFMNNGDPLIKVAEAAIKLLCCIRNIAPEDADLIEGLRRAVVELEGE